jgi:GR25 family glycosyltransferase involved in LPS biosynthesis
MESENMKNNYLGYTLFLVFLFHLGDLFSGIEQCFKPAKDKTNTNNMPQIDYIYMINLDKRPEKYQHTMDALAPYGIYPYRFSAVNGWELSFDDMDEAGIKFARGMENGPLASVYRHIEGKEIKSNEIMKEVGVTYYCHSLSRGAIGCYLSHLSVLQDAYDSGYKVIWVLEDDIRIVKDPRQLSYYVQALNKLAPKWDVLFTDNEFKDSNNKPVPCAAIRPRPNLRLKPLAEYLKRTPITSGITKIGMRFGSHSMIINRSGMKKILDYTKTYKIFYPYDIEYALIPTINLYMTNQDIVTNMAGWLSDNGAPAYEKK